MGSHMPEIVGLSLEGSHTGPCWTLTFLLVGELFPTSSQIVIPHTQER